MVNWEGDIERIVSIMVLHLSHPNGRVLVRLGRWKDEEFQVSCQLPGRKQMHGESAPQTFARFFQGPFAPFENQISFVGAELEESCKESKRMRIKTKYLRTVKHAELSCPVERLGLEDSQVILPRRR